MTPQEFREWIENCVRDARKRNLAESNIIFIICEQLLLLLDKEVVRVCSKQ